MNAGKENGGSESHPVMGWIGVRSLHESGQTSIWSLFTREPAELSKEEKQMDADLTACASINHVKDWDSIDWNSLSKQVRKLQVRIVKAWNEGRYNKAKVLQRILTHSFAAKAISVRRVTTNKGKNTPGVDNIIWKSSKDKMDAIHTLKTRGYKAKPLKRVYIPKKNKTENRPLGIPTMKDRALQALYLLALEPVAETTADKSSYGFRRERSTHDAIEHCFKLLCKKSSPQWILEGDIKGCFDNISHQWLRNNIPIDKKVLERWLNAGYIYKKDLYPTESGSPQGGVISPTLANMTLDGIERILNEKFFKTHRNGKYVNPKVKIVKYADDFIITADSKEILQNEVMPLVEDFLGQRGLLLSKSKTRITHINEGFNFLGQNIRKYKGKLLIKPSKQSLIAIAAKIKDIIDSNKTCKQEKLIHILNPVIRGWCEYHKHAVSSATFYKLDHIIWQKLWRWSLRRHKNKGSKWIKDKYFKDIDGRKWTFAAEIKSKKKGTKSIYKLISAGDTKIVRHTMIKYDANPYDNRWDRYFEERMGFKMLYTAKGKESLVKIWKKQGKRCIVCGDIIDKASGWCLHLDESIKKLQKAIIHPHCHKEYHNPQQAGFLNESF